MALRTPCRWTEFVHLRMRKMDPDSRRYDKLAVDAIARELGFRAPAIIRSFNRPADFDDAGLPEMFVVKPVGMTSRRGVMVLRRLPGRSAYFELLGNRAISVAEIIAEQRRWRTLWKEKRRGPYSLIVQEMVVGENGPHQIPFDYKFYVFDGVVRFTHQSDRTVRPSGHAFYLDAFGQPAYPAHVTSDWKTIQPCEPVVPRCRDALVATAQAVSRALKTPFISVDMYAGIDGPVIGELTSTPGSPYFGGDFRFTPAFDEELGRAWLDASHRLHRPVPIFEDSEPVRKRTSAFPSASAMVKKTQQAGQCASAPGTPRPARSGYALYDFGRLLARAKRYFGA